MANDIDVVEGITQVGDYQIAGRPAFESVWKRAWVDAWAFLSKPYLGIGQVLVTIVIAILVLATVVTDDTTRTVVASALFIVLICVATVAVGCAPLRQRSEARREAVRLLKQQEPKLTIREAVVQIMLPDDDHPTRISFAFRIRVENGSDGMAEKCAVQLLDVKPYVEWLPLVEGNRTLHGGNDFLGLPDLPLPVSLRWSANESSSIDIPARGRALLDVCYDGGRTILAFHSGDMRLRYPIPQTDLVFSIRVDSEGCLPTYCVCRYMPNAPSTQDAIAYIGRDCPNIDEYRQFKETPCPPDWDAWFT